MKMGSLISCSVTNILIAVYSRIYFTDKALILQLEHLSSDTLSTLLIESFSQYVFSLRNERLHFNGSTGCRKTFIMTLSWKKRKKSKRKINGSSKLDKVCCYSFRYSYWTFENCQSDLLRIWLICDFTSVLLLHACYEPLHYWLLKSFLFHFD